MQKRFWNWKDDDLTAQINQWLLGVLESGLYRGFDSIITSGALTLVLHHDTTGVNKVETDLSSAKWGVILTKQGAVITENASITIPIDVSLGVHDRIDTIIVTHQYSDSIIGGTPALYSVIKGTPASNPVAASIPSPDITTVLGYLRVTTDALTDLGSSVYTKEAIPTLANGDPVALSSARDTVEVTNVGGGVINVDANTGFYNNTDIDWLVKTGTYELTFSNDAQRISAHCPAKTLQATLEVTGRLDGTADYGIQTLTARVGGEVVVYKRDYTRATQSVGVTGDWLIISNAWKQYSNSSLSIGTGTKVFSMEGVGWDYNFDFKVKAYSNANHANYMIGSISSADTGGVKNWTMTVDSVGGSGTFDDWNFQVLNFKAVEFRDFLVNVTSGFPNSMFAAAPTITNGSLTSFWSSVCVSNKMVTMSGMFTVSASAGYNRNITLGSLLSPYLIREGTSNGVYVMGMANVSHSKVYLSVRETYASCGFIDNYSTGGPATDTTLYLKFPDVAPVVDSGDLFTYNWSISYLTY